MREHEITVVPTCLNIISENPFSGENVDEHVRAIKKELLLLLLLRRKRKRGAKSKVLFRNKPKYWVRKIDVESYLLICDVPWEKEYFSKRLTSKFRYILYLNFDVKRFEKYSFSYGTPHFQYKL